MRTSEAIDKIAPALVKAQSALKNPPRNKDVEITQKSGRVFKFEYSTLDSILDLVRPVLAENELAVIQGTTGAVTGSEPLALLTRILHSSGQWYETSTPIPYNGGDAKDLGAALTYTKRYSVTAMLGLASEEDKDVGGSDKGKKGPGKGTPGEGVGDALDEPTRNRMTDIATVVQDHAKAGKLDKAKEEWERSDFQDNAEAKIYAWSLIPSGTRRVIKQLQEAERARA